MLPTIRKILKQFLRWRRKRNLKTKNKRHQRMLAKLRLRKNLRAIQKMAPKIVILISSPTKSMNSYQLTAKIAQ